jgi:hypothetical protein
MREFFRGGQRKVGCVTLVMTCLFGVAWGRSNFIADWVEVPGWHSGSEWRSDAAYLTWKWQSPPLQVGKLKWRSSVILMDLPEVDVVDIRLYADSPADLNWGGLRAGCVKSRPWSGGQGLEGEIRTYFLRVHYWVLILPLTLLSTCLILWKPRKRPLHA